MSGARRAHSVNNKFIFDDEFPVQHLNDHGTTQLDPADTRSGTPVDLVEYYFEPHKDTVLGQLSREGITQNILTAGQKFRLVGDDHVVSSLPNADTMSKYSSLGLVSSDGILFRPTFFSGFQTPLLLEVPLFHNYNISANSDYSEQGISVTPTGDVFYTAGSNFRLHQMQTNVPLRTGSVSLQLSSRDETTTDVAQLGYRGIFELKLVFVKVH